MCEKIHFTIVKAFILYVLNVESIFHYAHLFPCSHTLFTEPTMWTVEAQSYCEDKGEHINQILFL